MALISETSRQANQVDWQKIQEVPGEKLSTFSLFQSISMAIQQGNAVCVMGCQKNISTRSRSAMIKKIVMFKS